MLKVPSTVMILPLTSTLSGACARAGRLSAASATTTRARIMDECMSYSVLDVATPVATNAHSLEVMPAALITGPQRSVSALSLAASTWRVEPTTATPSVSNRALTDGSASAAMASALILCTISGGVLTGTNNPYH